MAKKYAQDSFHHSGVGLIHQGQEINQEKFSAGDINELEKKGLIGDTDVATERKKARESANKSNKPAENK